MRHKIKTNRFGRFSSYRKATLNSLVRALILSESIKTTHDKAKACASIVEHLITLAKSQTLAARRQANKTLCDHKLVKRLFAGTASLFKDKNSGYTRVLKLGSRRGDGARMAILELTEKSVKPKKQKHSAVSLPHPAHPEEKPHAHKVEEKPKAPEKKEPSKKFFGGLRGFFKKERDSL